jgi:hypothetical protein
MTAFWSLKCRADRARNGGNAPRLRENSIELVGPGTTFARRSDCDIVFSGSSPEIKI